MYVLAVLLIVLVFIIILLCIPLEIELLILFDKPTAWHWRIRYLFNLINWAIVQINKGSDTNAQSSRESACIDIFRIKGLIARVFMLLQRIFRAIKFRNISADIHYSLGEDHYTGLACGYLFPALTIIRVITGSDLKIQPVFEDELKLEGYLRGSIMVQPIQLICPGLAFVFSRPVWQASRIMMRRQWKER